MVGREISVVADAEQEDQIDRLVVVAFPFNLILAAADGDPDLFDGMTFAMRNRDVIAHPGNAFRFPDINVLDELLDVLNVACLQQMRAQIAQHFVFRCAFQMQVDDVFIQNIR